MDESVEAMNQKVTKIWNRVHDAADIIDSKEGEELRLILSEVMSILVTLNARK